MLQVDSMGGNSDMLIARLTVQVRRVAVGWQI
jgi:hypothetical protein